MGQKVHKVYFTPCILLVQELLRADGHGCCIDLLVHHSVILELNIESYRMEVVMKNMNKKPDDPAKGSK